MPVAERTDETAVPRLADGTRVHVQKLRGLRIATHCSTIEQFVERLHRFCEDSAVFIPNVSRSLGAVTPFSFELESGQVAMAGIGTVVEELSTAENRFGRAGILIALQQLGRDSRSVFNRALDARALARDDRTPAPILARAFTAPVAITDPTSVGAPTPPRPDEVREMSDAIAARPAPTDVSSSRVLSPSSAAVSVPLAGRARTLVGLPISRPGEIVTPRGFVPIKVPAKIVPVAKVPLATPAVGTPTTKQDARASADAIPTPLSTDADAIPTPLSTDAAAIPTPLSADAAAIPTPLSADADDTIREERPWALRQALELDAAAPVAVSVRWSDDANITPDDLATTPVASTETESPAPSAARTTAEAMTAVGAADPISNHVIGEPERVAPSDTSVALVDAMPPPLTAVVEAAVMTPVDANVANIPVLSADVDVANIPVLSADVDVANIPVPSADADVANIPVPSADADVANIIPVPSPLRAIRWLVALALLFVASTAATLVVVGVPSVAPIHHGAGPHAEAFALPETLETPVPSAPEAPAPPAESPALPVTPPQPEPATDLPGAAEMAVTATQVAPARPIVERPPARRTNRPAKKSRTCTSLDCL